jgi:starch synthase (maltosyl-transferring)
VQLQTGETWLFKSRAALAAMLSSNYGIYNGFELIEHEPLPGREEFLDSEKYEIRTRDWDKPGNIKAYLGTLNRVRRDNTALQQTSNLRFLNVDDDGVIGFLKQSVDGTNAVAAAIAVTGQPREFWLHFGDAEAGGKPVRALENLITGETSQIEWGGIRLRIEPANDPAILFRCLT